MRNVGSTGRAAKLSEEDVKLRYITPALVESAGWSHQQIYMELITPGQIILDGDEISRGKPSRADYVLLAEQTRKPLAVVEAKALTHSVDAGLQQAMNYATKLDAPFAYSSNGEGFVEHDFLTGQEREIGLSQFPSEWDLWQRYVSAKGISRESERIISQPYHFDPFKNKRPRYYQQVAIDRTVEAIATGRDRLLLVMATGTGKTFTAFQIIWRLLEAGAVKRVLYLADRNVLIDQTISGDFQPLSGRVTKVKSKHLDSSYEIYMSLYQQLAGEAGEEPFRQFKPSFFDLIVVDECHRGSAREESLWRRVLEYFSDATQIGLTATPKETKTVSNIEYFGEPIYTYSLREGISDGFLAPYKVLRVGLNVDLESWRPYKGQTDVHGQEIEDREYNVRDFDKNLVIDERTKTVAKYITSWLDKYGWDSKTIIFCVDVEHAERMRRALVNENPGRMAKDWRYILRITGGDQAAIDQLDDFADPNETYPTIVTTSKLLTTGFDAKTIKLIVLESNIGSMTEFKQIIGRGTRLSPEFGKNYFTIMDFRGSTRLFADPEFDGEPVSVFEVPGPYEDKEGVLEPNPTWPDKNEPTNQGGSEHDNPEGINESREKVRVRGVDVKLLNERVQFVDPVNGKLITESIRDFSRKNILGTYATLDSFLQAWTQAERKKVILEELEERGVFLDAIRSEAGEKAQDVDDFDLILHIAYDKPSLTKRERVEAVKKRGYLHQYSDACVEVLTALLNKYAEIGISEFESTQVLDNAPFAEIGSPMKIAKLFGGKKRYLQAVRNLEDALYDSA